jgi:hypothetical protein
MTGSVLWHKSRSRGRRLRTIRNIFEHLWNIYRTSLNIYEDDGEKTHISPSSFFIPKEKGKGIASPSV